MSFSKLLRLGDGWRLRGPTINENVKECDGRIKEESWNEDFISKLESNQV